MTEVTAYKTNDGKLFEDKEKANDYEFMLECGFIETNKSLTDREQKIFNYLVKTDLTNEAISKVFNVSVRTIKAHVSSILNKYKVKNRLELIVKFHSNNLWVDLYW